MLLLEQRKRKYPALAALIRVICVSAKQISGGSVHPDLSRVAATKAENELSESEFLVHLHC